MYFDQTNKAMREVTLRIPDDKYDFFMELFEQLGLEKSDDFEIPEAHKEIVRERIRKSEENPEILLNWEDVKDTFKLE
ncbi:hypothetical protein P872_16840 [Rhodonellum psychrophilum GCM71 = DSM 17998]|uniref:Uncharacterized protein n=2 Tax=Rhodonellum TaxID=336827 RepID=U5C049_9BACT|nr:hypothetical protein P872_16840 [Rhodonellum psychrophilum GCM71 = DSM 17998]